MKNARFLAFFFRECGVMALMCNADPHLMITQNVSRKGKREGREVT